MSYLHYRNFLLEVSKGSVPEHDVVHKFGRNTSVPNGTFVPVSDSSTAVVHPSSASTVRVKAGGNVADTSTGTGAQSVSVQGISSTLGEVTETIALSGTSASSASATSFWRVHRAWVNACGTYNGANVGDVVIENSTSGIDYLTIPSSQGQSLACQYTIPSGKTGHLLSVELEVDGTQPADFRLMKREGFDDVTTPFNSYRIQNYWAGVETSIEFLPGSPISFPEKTDVWVEASGAGAGTECSANMEFVLVDNT